MLKRLDRLSKRHGASRSELIRMAILYFLEKGIKPEKGGE
ncbi:MAG: ribbon-helix-helix domain-containing protein [bacterium]